ncbi:hypothetical protein NPIL_4811 [Nephila pilipes]|uniref:Uncharacterized protein n=1 Tax=Nephila pilipes TaxID=299642 RepID=A0A8X6THF7_NEPPI|nr:hypothetical protein NPIL_4811 [Nephila pilipes]
MIVKILRWDKDVDEVSGRVKEPQIPVFSLPLLRDILGLFLLSQGGAVLIKEYLDPESIRIKETDSDQEERKKKGTRLPDGSFIYLS